MMNVLKVLKNGQCGMFDLLFNDLSMCGKKYMYCLGNGVLKTLLGFIKKNC